MNRTSLTVAAVTAGCTLLTGCAVPVVGTPALTQQTSKSPTARDPQIETHVQSSTFDLFGVLTLHDSRTVSTVPLSAFRISGIRR